MVDHQPATTICWNASKFATIPSIADRQCEKFILRIKASDLVGAFGSDAAFDINNHAHIIQYSNPFNKFIRKCFFHPPEKKRTEHGALVPYHDNLELFICIYDDLGNTFDLKIDENNNVIEQEEQITNEFADSPEYHCRFNLNLIRLVHSVTNKYPFPECLVSFV